MQEIEPTLLEVGESVKTMNNKKAPGMNEFPSDVLKAWCDNVTEIFIKSLSNVGLRKLSLRSELIQL